MQGSPPQTGDRFVNDHGNERRGEPGAHAGRRGRDTCFSNPGTSEMHFVAALDRVEGMNCVLCLFEGVATGAADGFARMTGRPGLTLLHLGPGLGNGLANLHNAKKAGTPIVNIVGEHTTQHLAYDAPLTSDTEGVARADVSTGCARGARQPRHRAGRRGRGDGLHESNPAAARQIATLILPADTAWGEGGKPVRPAAPPPRARVEEDVLRQAAGRRETRGGDAALRRRGRRAGGQPGACGGGGGQDRREDHGPDGPLPHRARGGRALLPRLPYPIDMSLAALAPSGPSSSSARRTRSPFSAIPASRAGSPVRMPRS